jgi:WD40 repeat protein
LYGEGVVLEEGAAHGIEAAALSPNGVMMAGALDNGQIRLWAAADGKQHLKLRFSGSEEDTVFGPEPVQHLSWSPDSRFLAVQPALPLDEVMVIDINNKTTVGQIR